MIELKPWLWQVVISEVGKDVPFQKLLTCPVGFKGRAEQIQTLEIKVRSQVLHCYSQFEYYYH